MAGGRGESPAVTMTSQSYDALSQRRRTNCREADRRSCERPAAVARRLEAWGCWRSGAAESRSRGVAVTTGDGPPGRLSSCRQHGSSSLLSHREAGAIAPGNDRKRPLRRRFAEQRLCRVLDGVVAPRADGDPRWLGGLGQGKGQFQHAMVTVGGDVSRRRRWSGYSTTKDESWTAKVPCCRFFSALAVLHRNLASGSASVSVFSRHVPDPSVIVALERYRSRRLLLARAATTCRRRAWDGQCVASTARKCARRHRRSRRCAGRRVRGHGPDCGGSP